MNTNHRRWALIATAVVICSSLGTLAVRDRFDSNEWKSASGTDAQARQRMIMSLFRYHPLVGKSSKEVVALLGEPDEPTCRHHDFSVAYALGLEPGWAPLDDMWPWSCLRQEWSLHGRSNFCRLG
jgi:hypothetical protein